ncbi:2-oxoadipate dioxygenase/decarboxylase HglS [Acinetobacter pseudolwoffii]|uniref:2-oxoadipate dioxygenase/decarboxylase HglS n=1 Tax=Acinetobacter pseudolwoffii TaxID=2053287 RepID=UPI0039899219
MNNVTIRANGSTKMSWINPDLIRAKFSKTMSDMYQQEVPLYGNLIDLVHEVNTAELKNSKCLEQQLKSTNELERLSEERHGAIRLGTAEELFNMRRIFAVMGMYPVGYYDLVPAGVPVHATAFRAVDAKSLAISPFRVFTSLLRLELIENEALRELASTILSERQIFTTEALALTKKSEDQGGLSATDAELFVQEVLETFRWHSNAPVARDIYDALHDQHRLIADVVAFRGPHINHLTPRTLNIDAVQIGMKSNGIPPKAVIEGPPSRQCPILLRQTSFKALEEPVFFKGEIEGFHSARFGEIEQRGIALTSKGRELYDSLLASTRKILNAPITEANASEYMEILAKQFEAFPDSYDELQEQGLGYFYYHLDNHYQPDQKTWTIEDFPALIAQGVLAFSPIVYEDFLPVSAAGIFQSNLGDNAHSEYQSWSNQQQFEASLGAKVNDLIEIYEKIQNESIQQVLSSLNKKSVLTA